MCSVGQVFLRPLLPTSAEVCDRGPADCILGAPNPTVGWVQLMGSSGRSLPGRGDRWGHFSVIHLTSSKTVPSLTSLPLNLLG